MRKFLIPLLFLLLVPFAYSQNISSEPVCIVYFYGDGCPNCAKIKP